MHSDAAVQDASWSQFIKAWKLNFIEACRRVIVESMGKLGTVERNEWPRLKFTEATVRMLCECFLVLICDDYRNGRSPHNTRIRLAAQSIKHVSSYAGYFYIKFSKKRRSKNGQWEKTVVRESDTEGRLLEEMATRVIIYIYIYIS